MDGRYKGVKSCYTGMTINTTEAFNNMQKFLQKCVCQQDRTAYSLLRPFQMCTHQFSYWL